MSWPMFRRVAQQAQHMTDVMERLDIDPSTAVRQDRGQAYIEARARCLHCQFARECERWLQGAENARDPAYFCPNAAFFAAQRRRH